jgi:hypothetical protein
VYSRTPTGDSQQREGPVNPSTTKHRSSTRRRAAWVLGLLCVLVIGCMVYAATRPPYGFRFLTGCKSFQLSVHGSQRPELRAYCFAAEFESVRREAAPELVHAGLTVDKTGFWEPYGCAYGRRTPKSGEEVVILLKDVDLRVRNGTAILQSFNSPKRRGCVTVLVGNFPPETAMNRAWEWVRSTLRMER